MIPKSSPLSLFVTRHRETSRYADCVCMLSDYFDICEPIPMILSVVMMSSVASYFNSKKIYATRTY